MPTTTPFCLQALKTLEASHDCLSTLPSWTEKLKTNEIIQDEKLMYIGQLLTDIDDLYNMDQPITLAQNAFYNLLSTPYWEDPYIQYLISSL